MNPRQTVGAEALPLAWVAECYRDIREHDGVGAVALVEVR
jgi:hypothetical protein